MTFHMPGEQHALRRLGIQSGCKWLPLLLMIPPGQARQVAGPCSLRVLRAKIWHSAARTSMPDAQNH